MTQGAVCVYGEGNAGCVCVYAYRCGVYLSDNGDSTQDFIKIHVTTQLTTSSRHNTHISIKALECFLRRSTEHVNH